MNNAYGQCQRCEIRQAKQESVGKTLNSTHGKIKVFADVEHSAIPISAYQRKGSKKKARVLLETGKNVVYPDFVDWKIINKTGHR